MYCRSHQIPDECLLGMHPADANFVFASYAANLFSGVNCNSLDIRATTVEEYLAAAQDLLVDGGYKHKAGLGTPFG